MLNERIFIQSRLINPLEGGRELMTNFIQSFVYGQHSTNLYSINIFQKFSRNSEVFASKLLENNTTVQHGK